MGEQQGNPGSRGIHAGSRIAKFTLAVGDYQVLLRPGFLSRNEGTEKKTATPILLGRLIP